MNPVARSDMPRTRSINALLLRRLGQIAESTGDDRFYVRLAEFFAGVLRSTRWLVVRYSRYGAPAVIVNAAMSETAMQAYAGGLYRLDPLLRLVQSGTREGCFSLRLLAGGKSNATYFDRLFQTAMIYDEAAVLLSAPGGGSIAICVERASRSFSQDDVAMMKVLYPIVRSLHQVHLDRTFSASGHSGQRDAQQAILILDDHGRVVFRNERWKRLERQGRAPDMKAIAGVQGTGMSTLAPDLVFHWEGLPETFALAPRGRFCAVEPRGAGYVTADVGDALKQFQDRFGLTPRERNIVDLVLQGYPNAKIAAKLGISTGTVRNHRYRLYYKLDITTERELFYTFIDILLGRDGVRREQE